jgi:hypothetical protein
LYTRKTSHLNFSELAYFLERAISKAGIRVWASQKEKTSLGPVMRSYCITHKLALLTTTYPRSRYVRERKTYLRNQPLEEAAGPFILHHAAHNLEPSLGVLEVPVLNSCLDDIERRRDEQRSGGTGDGSDEVLQPRGFVVVLQTVEVAFGKGGPPKQLCPH